MKPFTPRIRTFIFSSLHDGLQREHTLAEAPMKGLGAAEPVAEFELQHLEGAVVAQRVELALVPAQRRYDRAGRDRARRRHRQRAQDAQRRPVGFGEGPGIWRRARADKIMPRAPARPPIDGPIPRTAGAEVAAGCEILRPMR